MDKLINLWLVSDLITLFGVKTVSKPILLSKFDRLEELANRKLQHIIEIGALCLQKKALVLIIFRNSEFDLNHTPFAKNIP